MQELRGDKLAAWVSGQLEGVSGVDTDSALAVLTQHAGVLDGALLAELDESGLVELGMAPSAATELAARMAQATAVARRDMMARRITRFVRLSADTCTGRQKTPAMLKMVRQLVRARAKAAAATRAREQAVANSQAVRDRLAAAVEADMGGANAVARRDMMARRITRFVRLSADTCTGRQKTPAMLKMVRQLVRARAKAAAATRAREEAAAKREVLYERIMSPPSSPAAAVVQVAGGGGSGGGGGGGGGGVERGETANLEAELASAAAAATADASVAVQAADLGAFAAAVLRSRSVSEQQLQASSAALDADGEGESGSQSSGSPSIAPPPPIGLFVPRVLPKETLQAGIELKKYPRRKCCSARPASRVLWLKKDGQLCLARQKTAKAVKKAIRLENIARVEVGAKSRSFQGLGRTRYQLDVEGNEALCVSIYGSGTDGDAGGSFHVKLASKQAAEELVALLDESRLPPPSPPSHAAAAIAAAAAATGAASAAVTAATAAAAAAVVVAAAAAAATGPCAVSAKESSTREHVAAALVARCIRRAGARASMVAVVFDLRKRLAAMWHLLQQGFQVTKFNRHSRPSSRVLFMPKDGTLCLVKTRRAAGKKTIRLEDITAVVLGAKSENFTKSPSFASAIAGAERSCLSIYSSAASFHFRVGGMSGGGGEGNNTGQMLAELLQALARQVAGVGTPAEKRAQALNYARTGKLLSRYVAKKSAAIRADAVGPAVDRAANRR